MKKLLQVIGIAIAWTASGQGITTNQALNVTDFGGAVDPGIAGINLMGWSFTPTVAMEVFEMGCFTRVLDPGQVPISIGLWAKDTGALLRSVEISSGDPLSETTYIPVTEISLVPLQVYYIGAYSAVAAGISMNIMGPGFGGTFSPGDGIQLGTWSTNAVFAAPAEVTGALGVVPAGANFRFRVPEPSSLVLSCLAGFALLTWRSRRR